MARLAEESATNSIKVKIAPLMGEVREFILEPETTIAEALNNAGYNENAEVRVTTADGENQTISNNDSVLEDGDVITVIASGKVQAGL